MASPNSTTHATPKALLLAISGPSCSGKTTLSRLLRDTLLPHATIVHQDDFYRIDSQIPVVTVSDGRQLQDWDCREAVDFDGFVDMLEHVKQMGSMKSGFESKEDLNDVGEVAVDWGVVQRVKGEVGMVLQRWVKETGRTVVIVDGYLLFAEGLEKLRDQFEVKLLLTIDHDTMKQRREARKGYATIEGFWEDPEGYVDEIVWPNYVKDHKFLYRNGDIEAGIDKEACSELGIRCRPKDSEQDMTQCFQWAAQQITEVLTMEI